MRGSIRRGRHRNLRDVTLLVVAGVVVYAWAIAVNAFDVLIGWSAPYAHLRPDEIVLTLALLAVVALVLLVRRVYQLERASRARGEVEESLREQEARYRSIFENAIEGLYRSSIEGHFTDVNPALARMLGYETREELLALDLTHDLYVDPHDRAQMLDAVRVNGAVEGFETRLRKKDGSHFFARVYIRGVYDAAGLLSGFEGILTDVTEQKRTEAILKESEERYRLLVERSPVPVGVHQDGAVVYANPAMLEMFGAVHLEEVLGRPVADFVHPDYRAVAAARIRAALEENRPAEVIEEQFLRLDGSVIDVEVAAMPVHFAGRPAVQITARNITERKRVEEALRESEERYRSLLEHLPVGVYRTTQDGRIVEANAATAALLGCDTVAALQQRSVHAFYLDPAERRASLERYRVGPVESADLQLRRADGEVIWVRDYPRVVRDADGAVVCYDGVLLDITERKRAARALKASEERYRRLVEQSPEAILVHSRDGIVYANAAAARLTAAPTPEALLGRRLVDFVDPAHTAQMAAQMAEGFETGSALGDLHEVRLLREDGATIDVETIASLVTYQDEPALQIVVRDITERRRIEAEVAYLKSFYESALNQLPTEVAVLDREGRYLYVNPAAVRDPEMRRWMVGHTPVEYAHARGLDPRPFEERLAWVLGIVSSIENSYHEEEFVTRTGELRYFLRVGSPVLDEAGEVRYVVAYGVDLTDRKRFEEQLVQARDQAEEMARLKSAFLANMSHEIRTPLTGIIGFAAILEEELGDEHRELAQLIKQSGNRLLETLNSVLDLARIEANALELDLRPLDVTNEIREAFFLFRPLAEKKGLALCTALPAEAVRARLDRPCLHRILSNLLSNAVKFTDAGSVTVSLTPGRDAEMILRVADTGIGIDASFLPHLFDEFKQESTGLSRTHQGSGLGLAITKRLVELMNGRIEVASEKGRGSTFTITFPGVVVAEAAAAHSVSIPS